MDQGRLLSLLARKTEAHEALSEITKLCNFREKSVEPVMSQSSGESASLSSLVPDLQLVCDIQMVIFCSFQNSLLTSFMEVIIGLYLHLPLCDPW